jgi:hypothetical protein
MTNLIVEQQTALHRQRRFLILMSLAVIGYYLLGVGVKSEAQYSGFVLTLERPDRAVIGLWIVWGWSLLRYIQRVYELWSRLWDEVIEDVNAEDSRMVFAKAKKLGNQLAAQGKIGINIPKKARIKGRVHFGEYAIEDSIRNADELPQADPRGFFVTPNGGRRYPRFQAKFAWGGESNIAEFPMQLTPSQEKWICIRAYFHALFRLPGFTEYIAPFFVAAGALLAPALSCALS